MFRQISYFFEDYKKICGQKKARYLYVWMNRVTVGILLYRFERGMFLFMGKGWKVRKGLESTPHFAFSDFKPELCLCQ